MIAAFGIGCALVQRCTQKWMRVVLTDVEESAPVPAERDLRVRGSTVLADVVKPSEVEALAEGDVVEGFGRGQPPHLERMASSSGDMT